MALVILQRWLSSKNFPRKKQKEQKRTSLMLTSCRALCKKFRLSLMSVQKKSAFVNLTVFTTTEPDTWTLLLHNRLYFAFLTHLSHKKTVFFSLFQGEASQLISMQKSSWWWMRVQHIIRSNILKYNAELTWLAYENKCLNLHLYTSKEVCLGTECFNWAFRIRLCSPQQQFFSNLILPYSNHSHSFQDYFTFFPFFIAKYMGNSSVFSPTKFTQY